MKRWSVTVIVAIGIFMATLDSSIVNISLPAGTHALGIPPDEEALGCSSSSQEATTEPLYEHQADQREKVVLHESARSHTLVLVLTTLLILGLLGGIGFGYVLSLLHAGLGALP